MKCDHCHGLGNITVYLTNNAPRYRLDPCPQCHGSGIVSCCDGICEQPPRKEASDE